MNNVKIDIDHFAKWTLSQKETGKDKTFIFALGHLPGKTDIEAVRIANQIRPSFKITTDEFRKWLPQHLSKYFAEVMGIS